MKKIEFKDYPSTETPLNAEILNRLQDNIENAINNYSQEEQVIGTWIDGTPVYRRIVEYRFGEANTDNVITNIPNLKRFIKIDGYWVDGNTEYNLHQSFDGEEIFLYANASTGNICENHNFNYATQKYAFVIIEYIKTTD